MSNSILSIPAPANEHVMNYAPGCVERAALQAKLKELQGEQLEIPVIIGGKEVHTGNMGQCICPHDRSKVLATYHKAGPKEVQMAMNAAKNGWRDWSNMDYRARAAIFLRAAQLLADVHRMTLNATTMLGQSKTPHQAEIDAACELIDFWRFNVHYMTSLYGTQPKSEPGIWNYVEYRPLEGFVFAVTPFNFTSIAGNLPTAPVLMGNMVLWKPASTAVYSNYFLMKILAEAGLPDGVLSFLPGSGPEIGAPILNDPMLAGIHFTGSTRVFGEMWKTVGQNIRAYRAYPRLVGETGGKDFVVVHQSANTDLVAANLVRGAFEYQGQKCSAASRAYISKSVWKPIKDRMMADLETIKMGDTSDFSTFMGAVIDENAFDNIKSYIDLARNSDEAEIVFGGGCDKSDGFFIEPTVVLTTNPKFKLMEEEIFGPVLTIFVFDDEKYDETLALVDATSPYGLTGCVFARDRNAVEKASLELRNAAGNFYINDKPTGAVVGQQPFGGSRGSGTNDKAGSRWNLARWASIRTVKETFSPVRDYRYPYMKKEEE